MPDTVENIQKNRPTRAEISFTALAHNLQIIKDIVGDAKIMAVVKAEAYGHGLVPVAKELTRLGVDHLAVSFLEEGVLLRSAGITIPILVMGGLVDEQISTYLDYDLQITVSSIWKGNHVNFIAAQMGKKAVVHLKIDTGMGRIGQNWQTVEPFFRAAASWENIEIAGIYTHFATSDEQDLSFVRIQLSRFKTVLQIARNYNIKPEFVHTANSGAIMQLPEESVFNMVRPGIMLYGWSPSRHLDGKFSLLPVMTLRSQVVYVKHPSKGTTVGYGATWRATGDSWVATLPIGYGDGFPRLAGNAAHVMLRGRKCPIVGRVSMDQITIDAGIEAFLGDEVVFFGSDSGNLVSLWDLAEAVGTIPYEILCGLTSRVPRVIHLSEKA